MWTVNTTLTTLFLYFHEKSLSYCENGLKHHLGDLSCQIAAIKIPDSSHKRAFVATCWMDIETFTPNVGYLHWCPKHFKTWIEFNHNFQFFSADRIPFFDLCLGSTVSKLISWQCTHPGIHPITSLCSIFSARKPFLIYIFKNAFVKTCISFFRSYFIKLTCFPILKVI